MVGDHPLGRPRVLYAAKIPSLKRSCVRSARQGGDSAFLISIRHCSSDFSGRLCVWLFSQLLYGGPSMQTKLCNLMITMYLFLTAHTALVQFEMAYFMTSNLTIAIHEVVKTGLNRVQADKGRRV